MAYYHRRYGTRRTAPRATAREMTARYPGRCEGCGEDFPAGTRIAWHGAGVAYHAACADYNATLQQPATAPADAGLARAVAAGLGEDYADDSADERRQAARDEADYRDGVAAGERRSAERRVYGAALVEQWDREEEFNRFWKMGLED